MSNTGITKEMLRREMAQLLTRSVFEDHKQALAKVAVAYNVPICELLVRADAGDFTVCAIVPEEDLSKSLDYVSSTHLKPAAESLMHEVWSH
jgi:hypothetical protein